MAADLQDPPELIPRLLERWQARNDVVWAGRTAREGESWTTRSTSRIYYWLMRLLALPDMPKKGADVMLLDRKVIDAYNAIREKHTSLLAMILWLGFRQTSIEYVKQARHAGKSKWTLSKKLKLVVDSIVSFSYVPIRAMSLLGGGMALCGFGYATAILVGRVCGWVLAGTGFAALMTVLLIGQGSILLMLGILGEYLWRTYDEARGRPRYIVEEYVTSDRQAIAAGTPVKTPPGGSNL
jgi:dolichol-phosphate mannosyltransferase